MNTLLNLFFHKEIDRDDEEIYLQYIEKIKPDIIHIHGTENPFGCIIGKIDIPVVVSIQGNITVCYHKYLAGLELKYIKTINHLFPIHSLIKGLFPFYRVYRSFHKKQKIEERNLTNCRYIIGRTDWDRRISAIQAPRSEYFYGGEILRDIFYSKQWVPHKRDKLIIHSTNGNNPFKGFETLCEVVYLLNKTGMDYEWQVAGIGINDLIVKIVKRKLKDRFPRRNFRLMGSLNENDLLSTMLNADIFVMTSHIENSPNNLCEAMILGMPCITTFAGGTASLLSDGIDGILIQDGDPWAMAGAILELKNNPHKTIEYSKRARERALLRHNRETVTSQYLDIYNQVLDSSQNEN